MTITLTEEQFKEYVKCAVFCFEAHKINETYPINEDYERSQALHELCEVYDDVRFEKIPALCVLRNGEHRRIKKYEE